jgi:hypothetical protein
MKQRKPVFGIVCVVLSLLPLIMSFVIGLDSAGQVDIKIRNVMPFLTVGLAMVAFILRESIIWPIIGILLTGFYVALHFIA